MSRQQDGMKVRSVTRAQRELIDRLDPPQGTDVQPVNAVEWVDRNELVANDYNPNHVAPPERKLLKISLLADGWTQPIVARRDGEIVDGFHRWDVAADPDVASMTEGMVPVVFLREDLSPEHQRMSTIRHNRARGVHHVVRMADIVCELNARGMEPDEIQLLMQMEDEEVRRFLDHGNMLKKIAEDSGTEFDAGWTTQPLSDGNGQGD